MCRFSIVCYLCVCAKWLIAIDCKLYYFLYTSNNIRTSGSSKLMFNLRNKARISLKEIDPLWSRSAFRNCSNKNLMGDNFEIDIKDYLLYSAYWSKSCLMFLLCPDVSTSSSNRLCHLSRTILLGAISSTVLMCPVIIDWLYFAIFNHIFKFNKVGSLHAYFNFLNIFYFAYFNCITICKEISKIYLIKVIFE